MQVTVILHSILREKLPAEARGRAVFELAEGSRVRDILERLELAPTVVWAVNEQMDRDSDRLLVDGDTLRFLRPGAGG